MPEQRTDKLLCPCLAITIKVQNVPKPRISIRFSMNTLAFVAMAFAALIRPSEFWASATFTTVVVLLLLSILGVVFGLGNVRRSWAGFALFGWMYFLYDSWIIKFPKHPFFLPILGFDYLQRLVLPSSLVSGSIRPSDEISTSLAQVWQSISTILFALLGSLLVRLIPTKPDDPGATKRP